MRFVISLTAASLALAVASPPATAPTPAAQTAAPPAARTADQTYGLPSGDHVLVHDGVPHFLPAPGHSPLAFTSKVNGQYTVVPAAQLKHLSSLDGYRIGPAPASVQQPHYPQGLLDVKAVDHAGKPAAAAEILVVNADDPARATWDGLLVGGEAKIQIPAGHYGVAVAVFNTDDHDQPTDTELLSQTEVTVPATGATVSLDGRKANRATLATPLPSDPGAIVVGWERGSTAKVNSLDIGALGAVPLYVGAAGKAATGKFSFSVSARSVSPANAAKPYRYFFGLPKTDQIPASQAYRIDAAKMSTVDINYPTDQPAQHLIGWDEWTIPDESAANQQPPDLPYLEWNAPASDRLYTNVPAKQGYLGQLRPELGDGQLDGQLARAFQPAAGLHTTVNWRTGIIAPAPLTYDGSCYLCRTGDTLQESGAMDADYGGGIGQWSDGTATLAEDGKQIYTGSILGAAFDQKAAAGKHRYVYTMDGTHDDSRTALSDHSVIAWGFDSATTAKPAPVGLLWASAEFGADKHDSLAPGAAAMTIDFHRTDGVANVAKATAQVSFDSGKTWQDTAVTRPTSQRARAAFTIPAGAKPGYLSVRFHGQDAAGSTVDETVDKAVLVNAPNGLATSATSIPDAPAGTKEACPAAAAGQVRCYVLKPAQSSAAPKGLARADFLSAYKLPATGGNGRTVAIVDAFDDPTAEADLAVYRTAYGLPACTTANGCFKKVNGQGKPAPLPPADDGWSSEISLDLDMVSAVCPDCKIELVEAGDASTGAMAAAEKTATSSGAVAVSNSWGGDETGANLPYTAAFSHPGVAVTASTGDRGYRQASWPATLSGVIAVGGTSLTKSASGRGWTESAWGGSGSGCSAYTAKPAWQKDPHCSGRTFADISAVADPATGVAVYDRDGWGTAGGTSASAPLIAAMIALAGNSSALPSAQYIYAHASSLNDVTTGSNARWNCGGDYLCTAGKGYDAPTGLGTPNGLGAL
ncbi:S53 family peptidase [Amycolatopsis benzoatilytica]|uniref:S53 family peptidase n=1 Tax=Amycolatopsis benzoatilytica TaxID=346045 RepID=UPI00037C360E|nr:S53 family peptidase [Amycolatopsis benzoatilytica]